MTDTKEGRTGKRMRFLKYFHDSRMLALLAVCFYSVLLPAQQADLTSCKTPSGGKQNICFYETPREGRVFCLGSSFGECPSLDTCKNEFKSKLESKKWAAWSITGRNTPSTNGGASVPATKKCRLVAEQNNKQFNNIHKYISVECGDSPMYLATKLKKKDGSYNNLQMTAPIVINGKKIDIKGDVHMVWSALMKQSLDNEMENKSVKVQKIQGERDILEKIKASGVDLSQINSRTKIEFSYTPPSKEPHDQAIFLTQKGPNSIRQIVVCPDQKDEGYQSFFDEFPVEIYIKECAESIYVGTAITKLGLRSAMNKDVACFGKKDELYCVNADKCMNDEYSSQPFVFDTPRAKTGYKNSSQKQEGQVEN